MEIFHALKSRSLRGGPPLGAFILWGVVMGFAWAARAELSPFQINAEARLIKVELIGLEYSDVAGCGKTAPLVKLVEHSKGPLAEYSDLHATVVAALAALDKRFGRQATDPRGSVPEIACVVALGRALQLPMIQLDPAVRLPLDKSVAQTALALGRIFARANGTDSAAEIPPKDRLKHLLALAPMWRDLEWLKLRSGVRELPLRGELASAAQNLSELVRSRGGDMSMELGQIRRALELSTL